MQPRRGSWPAGDSAAASRASSLPAVTPSAMGRATRGTLDKRTPRGRGTGKEPSERVAPPAGSDTLCRWGGAPPDAASPVRTRTTGAGLARGGVASVTALDRTGSGPDRLRTGRRWPRSQRRPPTAGRPPRATSNSKSTIMFKQTKILDAQNYSRVH